MHTLTNNGTRPYFRMYHQWHFYLHLYSTLSCSVNTNSFKWFRLFSCYCCCCCCFKDHLILFFLTSLWLDGFDMLFYTDIIKLNVVLYQTPLLLNVQMLFQHLKYVLLLKDWKLSTFYVLLQNVHFLFHTHQF